MRRLLWLGILAATLAPTRGAFGQGFASDDPIIKRIWAMGMDSSQVGALAQVLDDSIGPRLTGTPGIKAGNAWLLATYAKWGIGAENVQYGTWKGWKRGPSHFDLIAPRVRSLEGMLLAWVPGTKGKPVDGPVVILPDAADSAAFAGASKSVKGAYVLISAPEPTCRPDSSYKESALPEEFERMTKARAELREAWAARVKRTGLNNKGLQLALQAAGARGVLTSNWSQGWGSFRIFDGKTTQVPAAVLSCEDYGLLYRLAEHNQGPVLRVTAEAEDLGEVPVFNTIATIPGTDRADEYVVLSAHFDSWDGSSGATDNGTGTVVMMEAMRILKAVLPRPSRTIIVGHWSGEEQGLNGSRAYMADHPKVVSGLQALFNQDNGTGRVSYMSAAGLMDAGGFLAGWLSKVPTEITGNFKTFQLPGTPAGGGSDNASVACYGAPGFGLGSLSWEYFSYTWHTNRDTYDKLVLSEVANNATLTAMLAYQAAQDPDQLPRERRIMPVSGRTGEQLKWPECQPAARSFSEYTR
ncbi:MAG TPA: M28 family peptidase [Gemmatimonadales bacterium]|nr:M28 family peptidase [Gemmatimonadales bacterium]